MVKTDMGEGLGGVTVQTKIFADKNTQVVVAEGRLERKVENGITAGESLSSQVKSQKNKALEG